MAVENGPRPRESTVSEAEIAGWKRESKVVVASKATPDDGREAVICDSGGRLRLAGVMRDGKNNNKQGT